MADLVDHSAIDRRKARELAPAMLAMIREQGPIDHLAALHELKAQGRVKPGVRFGAARRACELLEADGLLEAVDNFRWRVPSDSALIVPAHDRDGRSAGAAAGVGGVAAASA